MIIFIFYWLWQCFKLILLQIVLLNKTILKFRAPKVKFNIVWPLALILEDHNRDHNSEFRIKNFIIDIHLFYMHPFVVIVFQIKYLNEIFCPLSLITRFCGFPRDNPPELLESKFIHIIIIWFSNHNIKFHH